MLGREVHGVSEALKQAIEMGFDVQEAQRNIVAMGLDPSTLEALARDYVDRILKDTFVDD